MKTFRYVTIFLLIFFTLMIVHGHNVSVYGKMINQKVEFNNVLDSAMDSAVAGIVERADGNELVLDFDACVNNFYRDLYAGFGAMDSPTMQAKLDLYTPVLAIADSDGLYVHYTDIFEGKIIKVWSQKIPYTYAGVTADCSYTVNFTMNDEVIISIEGIDSVYSGHWAELKKKYPANDSSYGMVNSVLNGEVLGTSGDFQAWKNETITSTITKQLNYYVNRHNQIASVYGEQFTFNLPVNAASVVARGVEDVSFMCFFQGYPFGTGTQMAYSRFEISGARITKNSGYYVQPVDNYLYYHRSSCGKGLGSRKWYATQKECARNGALPCAYCNP